MNRILEVYNDLFVAKQEPNQRFIDEIFEAEIYREGFPRLTVIDGGAYEGELGFYYYGVIDRCYCFEPDPRPYAILERRVSEFGANRMIISKKALAGDNGKRYFHNTGYGGSTLSAPEHKSEDSIEVETITLATVIKENNIETVDILKVDMEDAEKEVFAASDFPEIASKIKLIIGEHLQASEERLVNLGFVKENYPHGFIYRR